jgi:hypothetical protein
MRRTTITTVITALLALTLVSAASARVLPGHQNWENLDTAGQPRATWLTNQVFHLKSYYNNSTVGYGERTYGINMTWGGDGNWVASLPGHGGTRAIGNSDRVALFNSAAGKYLVYGYETWGVDLVWSSTPKYEWMVSGSGIHRGLYNTANTDYLEYGERTWGINLVWSGHELADQSYTEPPDYQPVALNFPQVAYVTLSRALNAPFQARYTGRLTAQAYHSIVVDEIQNTSHYPISFVAYEYPAPDHCHGMVLRQGQILSGQALTDQTRDQQGSRTFYDVRSCGAAGGTGDGSDPLVRITYHYVS